MLWTPWPTGRVVQLLVIPIDGLAYPLPERGDDWPLRLGGWLPTRYDSETPEPFEPVDATVRVTAVEAKFGSGETSYVEGVLRTPERARVTAYIRTGSLEIPSGLTALWAADGVTEARAAAAIPSGQTPVGYVRLVSLGPQAFGPHEETLRVRR